MVRPARFERATTWFEAKYSNPLSYGRITLIISHALQFLPQPQQTKTISIQSRTLGISTRGR